MAELDQGLESLVLSLCLLLLGIDVVCDVGIQSLHANDPRQGSFSARVEDRASHRGHLTLRFQLFSQVDQGHDLPVNRNSLISHFAAQLERALFGLVPEFCAFKIGFSLGKELPGHSGGVGWLFLSFKGVLCTQG